MVTYTEESIELDDKSILTGQLSLPLRRTACIELFQVSYKKVA